jgi:diacylglycerol O-acyltransferase
MTAVARESPFDRVDEVWGESDGMSALEATMWRAEADAHLRSHGVLLELLDATPEWERLIEGHRWAVRRMPKLRQRVVEDPLRLGPPAWVGAEVDLSYHVRRERLPAGAVLADVMSVAANLHMKPFDPARPLWEALLVEGLPDDRSAFLLKLHHAYADGLGIIQLLDLLHSDRREPTRDKPALPDFEAETTDGLDVLERNLRRSVGGALGGARRAVSGLAGGGARLLRDPVRSAAETAAFARSLARVTGGAPGTPSPLLGGRGLSRRLVVIDVPLAQLRAAGKSAGGTLNDAFVAALAGGVGRYHAERDVSISDLPFALPVSLRNEGDDLGGNRFAGARIAAPAGDPDPARRIATLRRRVLAAREEPALDFMGLAAPVMSRIPAGILTRLTASFTRSIDLQASNIRGLDRPAFLAGARVERMFPFGPLPGSAIMATLVSHEGRCCVGVTLDSAAVTDVEAMARCLQEGFDEVLRLAPGSAVS